MTQIPDRGDCSEYVVVAFGLVYTGKLLSYLKRVSTSCRVECVFLLYLLCLADLTRRLNKNHVKPKVQMVYRIGRLRRYANTTQDEAVPGIENRFMYWMSSITSQACTNIA